MNKKQVREAIKRFVTMGWYAFPKSERSDRLSITLNTVSQGAIIDYVLEAWDVLDDCRQYADEKTLLRIDRLLYGAGNVQKAIEEAENFHVSKS